MLSIPYVSWKRVRRAVAVVVLVFFVGWGIRYFFFQPSFVPRDFADARQRSYNIAQAIVKLSSDSLVDLSHIAGLDRAGKAAEALAVVQQAIGDNLQARQEAVQLSATLEVMAKNLPEIMPSRGRNLATEGLGYEVNLINHLITYNDYLSQLLAVLQDKFDGTITNADFQIKKWISLINDESEAINGLNKKYTDVMLQFDRVTAR